MNMFANYLKERLNKKVVVEPGKGFAVYLFNEDNDCYIEEIYVEPEFRKSKVASDMANKIEFIARDHGSKMLLGSVAPSANNSTISLQVLLGYGFKLLSSQDNRAEPAGLSLPVHKPIIHHGCPEEQRHPALYKEPVCDCLVALFPH